MAKSSKSKMVTIKCERCLHDTQIFAKGDDTLTYKATVRYAKFTVPADQVPKPDEDGNMLEVDLGEDYELGDYENESWTIEVKDAALRKKVKKIIDEGADTAELSDLGFENTGGQWDIIPEDDDSFVIEDPSAEPSPKKKIEKLKARGDFLVRSEEAEKAHEAIDLLSEAAELQKALDPASEELQFINTSLGKAYAISGNHKKALEVFENVKREYTSSEGRYSSGASYINGLVAELLIKDEKYDEAIPYMEQSLLFDGDPENLTNFAKLLSQAGKKKDAVVVLRIAEYKCDHDNYALVARIQLEIFAALLSEPGKQQEAKTVLEEATTSAELSDDEDLIKECKAAKKLFGKK